MRLTTLARRLAPALLLLAATVAHAQRTAPARPKLVMSTDTNSAQAYFQHGLERIAKYPHEAADAFYWASRLAPSLAEPYYARATAMLLTDKPRLWRYLRGDRAIVEGPFGVEVDSLRIRAYQRNPLLATGRYDFLIVEEVVHTISGGEDIAWLQGRTGDAATDAMLLRMRGEHEKAVKRYAEAIRRNRKALGLRADRARAFAAMGAYDSAAAEIDGLLEAMREQDKAKLEHAFESAAMFEFMLGYVHAQRGQLDEAKAAFERSLVADLSFGRAHAGLGELAMHRGDTAQAMLELGQAVELRPDDVTLRSVYALALIRADRAADAVEHLREAVKLEPYYAHSYYLLGRLLDHGGFADEAHAEYTRFLAHAAQDANERAWVTTRIAALKAAAQ